MTGRVGALGRGAAVSLVPAHTPGPLCSPPAHTPLPLSPFSPSPDTHLAVPCLLPPATNLQGTRSWSHTGPPTPVAPRPHCHSPRKGAMAIGAMRQEQLGDSETAAEKGSGRRAAFSFQGTRSDMMSPPQCCNCGCQGVVSLGIRHGLLCMKLELQSLLGCHTQAVTSQLSHASCKALPVCVNARHHLRGCKTQDTWLQWGVPHGMSQVVPNTSSLLSPQTLGSKLCPHCAFLHHPQ